MVAFVQFSVDDSSPLLAYAPFPDTFGPPDLTAGWNPYFVVSAFASAIGQTGVGQSQHITSHNGSSISLHWHGTSLQLFGNTTADASLSLALDGASVSPNNTNNTPNLLAFLDGLPQSDHVLVLTALTPSPPDGSLVVFDKAVITDLPPQNSSDVFSDHTLDDNDISFTGQWSPPSVATPFYESRSQGDTAQVTFSGISVRIFGTTSPTSGNYSIMLDDIQSPIFSARSSFTQLDSLLFFASGLDPNVSHHIVVRNEGGSLQLKSGGTAFDIFSSGEPTALPSPPSSPGNPPSTSSGIGKFAKGTIAALVLAGFLAAALLTAVLFYFCIWRPRRRMRHRQQPLDAVEGATSQLHRSRKKEQDDAAGVVLDIGQQPQRRHPDDDIINTPIDALSPLSPTSPSNARPYDEQHRDVHKSPGFTRWRRDMNALSGLTSIGLKFNHEGSDEKSPLSDNGRGNGLSSRRYESEVDDISPITPIGGGGGLGRMMSLTTQSSYRSLRRIGKKRSNGTNGGRGGGGEGGFPFRFNSGSSRRSNNNNNNNNGEGPVSSPRARDEDSLSGFTSLSYASNPNLGQSGDAAGAAATTATATTTYLDVQPPSYAASVSHNTTSGSSSVNQSPRTSSGTPSARDVQERQAIRSSSEQRQQRQSSSSSSSGNQQQLRQQRSDTRMRGIRMLGIGAGSTATGGGVGGPISMRAAIRALSPRISRNRNGGGKKEEREEEEEEVEEGRDRVISPQPSIALASIGHDVYEQQQQENVVVPRIAPPPVMIPQRRKTDSPIRALPPIPIPATAVTSVPESPSKLEKQQQQRRGRDVASIAVVPPSPSSPSSPPPPPSSSSLHSPTRLPPPPPPIITTTTAIERKPCINTKVARSSPSDAVGLPPLGTIQSFAEAAAIAINTGGFVFGEGGTSTPNTPAAVAGDATKAGKGQRETKRSSTASRVRFEEPSNVDSSTVVPIEGGDGKRKEEKEKFRLTPPTPLTGGGVVPASSSSSEYPPLPPDLLPIMTIGDYNRSSFLDFSSKASSLHSTPSVHRTQDNADNNTEDNGNNGRIWSMHLPGRRVPLPSPPTSSPSQYSNPTLLKSKWSNTTMQTTTRTLGGSSVSASSSSASSNNRSGYGLREQWVRGGRPLLTAAAAAAATEGENEGDVLSPMTRQNLFPFPLTIPPSPNMPEGFMGVEPSPSLMSPTVSLPVPISSTRKRGWRMEGGEENRDEGDNDEERHSRNRPSSRHTGNEGSTDATNSPTDSFPYTISDVHFRNSGVLGSESEMDMLDEDRGQSRRGRRHPHPRHTHHTHHQPRPPHPPLPSSTSLFPQRFDPSLSLSSSTSLSQQQQQQQQQQQHEERTPGITTIVQRVFGTSGNGNNGNNGHNNDGNGNGATLRAAAGLLKPS